MNSFIIGRTQRVRVGDQYSVYYEVDYGVPQGSALGPVLFLLYTADVLIIAARHSVSAHSYADDTQMYVHTTTDNCLAVFGRLTSCINEIADVFKEIEIKHRKAQFTCLGTMYQQSRCFCLRGQRRDYHLP